MGGGALIYQLTIAGLIDEMHSKRAGAVHTHTHTYGLISAKELINKTLGFHQN